MNSLLISTMVLAPSIALEAATWTPEAIIQMKVISDVQISPDNKNALFVGTEPKMDGEKGSMISLIYKAKLNESSPASTFLDSPATQPRWSPDGKWIALLKVENGISQLALTSSQGEEPLFLTEGKYNVQTYSWSPDGKKIAFVMADETEAEKARPKTSLAYNYKHDATVNRLWVIDVFSKEKLLIPLTTDDYCVRGAGDFGTINAEFDWSPDGQEIVFAHSPSAGLEDYHVDSSLAKVNVATREISSWKKCAVYESMPRFSPDGKSIGYLTCNSTTHYSIDRQAALRTAEGEFLRLLSPTFNEGVFLGGANFLGWSQDGMDLILFEPKGTKFHLMLIPADGKPAKEIETGDLFFKEPALNAARSSLGFVVQSPSTPPEAFFASFEPFKPQQISSLNASFLDYPKAETEIVHWRSSDGLQIEGLLTYPIGYQKGNQYPLLLVIHGGPMGFFDETFLGTPNPYPLAAFAQEGFFVFRPNPRGSTGYGRNFRVANYKDWGGNDCSDILSGIDALIAKGLVDKEKLGVMGWSYGGYMTSWITTQTHQFKAASIGAGPCNLVSMKGTSDLFRFMDDYFGDFLTYRSLYEERSPIYFVQNIETPCLIQHGTTDQRVPVSQALEFFHGLDRLNKTVQLILYPNMGHRLTDPKMQLDAMNSNLSWFTQYVKGE